jgi:hypothetical protein
MAERQGVPELDQMDERAAHKFLTELYSLLSARSRTSRRVHDGVVPHPFSDSFEA